MEPLDILMIKTAKRDHDNLGQIEAAKACHNVTTHILEEGILLPSVDELLQLYDGIITYGGAGSVNEEQPFMSNAKRSLGGYTRRGGTFFGICLGKQIIANDYGNEVGDIATNPVITEAHEHGYIDDHGNPYTISLEGEDPFLKGIPRKFNVLQLRGQEVKTFDKCHIFGRDLHGRPQVIGIDQKSDPETLGFARATQFHFDMYAELLQELMEFGEHKKNREVPKTDTGEYRTVAQHREYGPAIERIGKQFFRNMFDIIAARKHIRYEANPQLFQ